MARRRNACWMLLIVGMLSSLSLAEMVTRRWGTPPAGPPSARVQTPKAKPPTCYVAATTTPPKLDGRLDDEVWKRAQACSLARTLDGAGTAAQPTEVLLLRDEQTLYLAFRCTEPMTGKLQASGRSHDGPVWEDDSVEFFIGLGGEYYHFGVNAVAATYDAKAKDASWNSGFRAAAGKEPAAWTLEVAIPLASMAGKGKVPTEWTADFFRNRRVTGTVQESCWSPTYSGDSHVPSRFGKMLFQAPPVPRPGEQPDQGVVEKGQVTILPAEGGLGIVRFNLSGLSGQKGLPRGAKVYRADLLIFRTVQVDGRMDECRTDIEIYPVMSASPAEGKPKVSDKPLALRGPWFDRFDATDAVRQWVSGKSDAPSAAFFVKACPFWNAQATCLDVAYEGQPTDLPPHVTELRALHRSGQTFLTWREIDDPVGTDRIAWGAMKRVLDGLDAKRRVRYCVYRHDRPITAGNLHQAELIATVKPLSCWNIDGRNTDRPIDHFIATSDVLMTGHWNPFGSASIDGEYGRDCPIDRFVIREGAGGREPRSTAAGGPQPLPRGTGLYVHTATRKRRAFYAVLTCIDGVQNTADLSAANALAEPVDEAPADPQPVLQGELPPGPLFDYDQKRLHYVRWAAAGEANVPYQYHNWSVGVPEKGSGAFSRNGPEGASQKRLLTPFPLELSLHRDGHSYWRTQYRIERDSIVLCPYDFPVQSWWYGYHEAYGTLRSFGQGCIQPYTERRLLSFVRWACEKWPVDADRILVTGCRGGASGSGALHLAIRHRGVFSLVIAGHPIVDYAAASRRTDRHAVAQALSMQAVWGKADWDLGGPDGESFPKGPSVWARHNMVKVVASLPPAAELPYVTMTSSHTDADSRAFYTAMLARHAGIMAEFSWGGARYVPVSNTGTYPNVIRLDIRRNKSCLAFVSAQGRANVAECKMGDFNRQFRWREVVDEPDRYEATIFLHGQGDTIAMIAPRRLQKFKLVKGKTYVWRNASLDGKADLQSGEATVGEDGLLVLKDVAFSAKTPEGSRLIVTPK